ncbi:type II toxin-antitoxin system VapC family toxin [Candidatus Woesearchaeota archaeon]|nr:type II toxin-antitoxin system VapC family toxin [Candidatus Woesearchaeota archaeon]
MEPVCLDSTWIYDFLKGKRNAVVALEAVKSSHSLATTSINAYEIIYGLLRKKEEKKLVAVMELFKSVRMLDFDLSAAGKAAQIGATLEKKGKMINEFDILVAGAMLANDCRKIITENTKDFEKVDGITVL